MFDILRLCVCRIYVLLPVEPAETEPNWPAYTHLLKDRMVLSIDGRRHFPFEVHTAQVLHM